MADAIMVTENMPKAIAIPIFDPLFILTETHPILSGIVLLIMSFCRGGIPKGMAGPAAVRDSALEGAPLRFYFQWELLFELEFVGGRNGLFIVFERPFLPFNHLLQVLQGCWGVEAVQPSV